MPSYSFRFFSVLAVGGWAAPPLYNQPDQTDVTKKLNKLLEVDKKGRIYKGGRGVRIRALNDGLSSTVVPASLIVNDIHTPSTMYVDGDPRCPHNGDAGWGKEGAPCSDDPFDRANVGVVIGDDLPLFFHDGQNIQDDDWGWGVFYGTDANAADSRCFYVEKPGGIRGYDCPGGWQNLKDGVWIQDGTKKGAGNLQPGNPNATWKSHKGGGGGAGCHFNQYGNSIDQFDAYAGSSNIVLSYNCECNYALKNNLWQDWVRQWMNHAHNKVYSDHRYDWMAWFKPGKGAPSWGMDLAACWVNNPRDMIQIQNAMWWFKDTWNNLLMPQSLKLVEAHPEKQRHYWGWNEVPVSYTHVTNASHWDSIFIKLPPAACGDPGTQDRMSSNSLSCLSPGAVSKLESLIAWYISKKYLIPGSAHITTRPGSYVVLLREWYAGNWKWQRDFFCESWNAKKYKIVFKPMSSSSKAGVCYIDYAPIKGGPIRLKNSTKCMDLAGGDLTSGSKIQIWDCNGVKTNQNWVYTKGALRSGVDQDKCVDL